MAQQQIKYKKGYKYQLYKDYCIDTDIKPKDVITIPQSPFRCPYVVLGTGGELNIYQGYAWDGATGAPDTKSVMRASLIHDALYQCMREYPTVFSPLGGYRKSADKLFRKICIQDGLSRPIAWIYYIVIRFLGRKKALPGGSRKVITAP